MKYGDKYIWSGHTSTGSLTFFWWFTSALLLRRSSTIRSWPFQLAIYNAVWPSCTYKGEQKWWNLFQVMQCNLTMVWLQMISVKLTNLFTRLKKYTNQLQLYTKTCSYWIGQLQWTLSKSHIGVEVHRAGKFCLGIRFVIYTPLNGRNKMCLRIDVHENDVQTRKPIMKDNWSVIIYFMS